MTTKRVVVLPYDPQWRTCFEQIKGELEELLGDLFLAIEHVGSTSVPGLSAKPIIDIDVVIESYDVFPNVVEALKAGGYEHEGNLGIPEREAFRYDGKQHLQKHHLYVCPADSEELHRHLTFRNYLRQHPGAAGEYGRIKEEAARRYPDSIEDYIQYKSACIAEIYRQCGLQ
ncbi:MAG: GrpB family protein [Oscillospiraceae bacterium]|nr:GrpB family protein [Oscillospiraceae bacterium]